MLDASKPSLILAPMEGITDSPMRALQTETGNFTHVVSEFIRVSIEVLPPKVFRKEVPELANGAVTPSGTPVQVQILGGDPDRMAASAVAACKVGAKAIDINFGCPAQTVNRNDGGATLLKYPDRIRDIVKAVREAVPTEYPVSAKLRLGWDDIQAVHLNARMATEGGASWITIHARTRLQAYNPPVYWGPIGEVRRALDIPVVANGDIWTIDAFRRCQDMTGCHHFMIGRSALSNPRLSYQIANELGIRNWDDAPDPNWIGLLQRLEELSIKAGQIYPAHLVKRMKQWLRLASNHGDFPYFDALKRIENLDDFYRVLERELAGERTLVMV